MNDENKAALKTLEEHKVAIFIVAYNAQAHIEKVLHRIPDWIREKLCEIYVIDDCSTDETYSVLNNLQENKFSEILKVYQTPQNLGYGGNQILGYKYAIKKQYDIVILLHGDGQYAPESLPHILAAYQDDVDAVFGSRFIEKKAAINGGMPLYKWWGNRILTRIQNFLIGGRMNEFHSGFRSYKLSSLSKCPFEKNSRWFDFDADIIYQFHALGLTIKEVNIPTYYGDEICYVNGIKYAWRCIKGAVKFYFMKYHLFYDPKYDVEKSDSQSLYQGKSSPLSVHYHVINHMDLPRGDLLDLGGGGDAKVSKHFLERNKSVTCVDKELPTIPNVRGIQADLDQPWSQALPDQKYEVVLALDVIEHLSCPEKGMKELYDRMSAQGVLVASTGNIAFFITRVMLFLGAFNYGKKGLLDLTHKRLFTINSFKRMIEQSGFEVIEMKSFGIPLTDVVGKSSLLEVLEKISFYLSRMWPGLFAYQILFVAKPIINIDQLESMTFKR